MAGTDWKAGDVLTALEHRGYQRLPPSESMGKAVRYESPFSSAEVSQYVHLNYKTGARAYDIWVGWSNAKARELLERCLTSIQPLADPVGGGRFPQAKLPCWTWFNACRVLGGYHLIPLPTNRREGPAQFATVVETFLEPIFETTRSAADIVERLLRDTLPLEWLATNPIPRAAEIMATSLAAGRDLDTLMPQLRLRAPKRQYLGEQWPEVLERLASLLSNCPSPASR